MLWALLTGRELDARSCACISVSCSCMRRISSCFSCSS